jgi:hypothetical protein
MNLQSAVLALLATAATVLAATWHRSPVHLPLPKSPHARWLRVVPVLATVVIIGVLSTWCTDCIYLQPLNIVAITAFALCALLLIWHHDLLRRRRRTSTLMVVVCFGWSILGTLSVSATATLITAKSDMDAAYKKKPLTLWQIVDGKKRKPLDAVYLTAGLPAHFRGEMNECHNTTPTLALSPNLGRLVNGTYSAPKTVTEEQQVTITARSPFYGDEKSATIILLPDPPHTKRRQYPVKDNEGREGVLDLIIISDNNSWVYESDEFVEQASEGDGTAHNRRTSPVCRPILDLAGSHAFDPYVDVIAIGTASREGSEVEEEGRAGRRSRRIAEWVNLALRNKDQSKHVYTMNLGQYHLHPDDRADASRDETAHERPVVIMGVVRGGDIDLTSAVRNVFDEHQNDPLFRFLTSHYPGRWLGSYNAVPTSECR